MAGAPGAGSAAAMRRGRYAECVRCLFLTNHCVTDPTAGAMRSLRTMAGWLQAAGHPCRMITTARFGSPVPFTIDDHLRTLGEVTPLESSSARPPAVQFADGDVPVWLLLTRHNDERRPDRRETARFESLVRRAFDEFAPDLVVACNGHPMIRAALATAKARGAATVFALRGYGYDDRRYFSDVDAVLSCSGFLTRHYEQLIGLSSVAIPPPLEWATVEAPDDGRAFVTFVHPSPHKGLFHFARLADMLGARRPDIPILVVGSGHSAGALNGIPGLDFSRYPQIMAAPPVPTPADYLALTRVLLVPSVFAEPFGRVAAEAMVNAIPSIVSDRGGLPEVVGGDADAGGGAYVRPLPSWLTHTSTRVPSEAEVAPWFDAVCRLWDDAAAYARIGGAARRLAVERYSEPVLRAAHLEFFQGAAGR